MKNSKRYILFAWCLAAVFLLRFSIMGLDRADIATFRGGTLKQSVWNPLIANDVNGGLLRVVIDNKEYTNENVPFYMDENRSIMIPVSILRDAFNCSAHIYGGTELLVEKRSNTAHFWMDQQTAAAGEEEVSLTSAFTKVGDEYYVSLNDLSKMIGYGYSFDIAENSVTTADTSENTTVIPTRYDLRERGRVSQIRDQGSYGTCWAFAATSALESSLMPEQNLLFSVDHMTMSNSFSVNQYDGGEYTMGMAYLAAWQGPVYETDDPYGDGETDGSLSPVKHVQEMRIIDGKDYESIKAAVFKYGGVQTSLYSTLNGSQKSSSFYDAKNHAYCYIGTQKPNHDVVIIGWDDNYPKENFSVPLEGDGAFICQNSWGSGFGEDGVFYVSYYDTNIGTHNIVYTRVDDTDNYSHIYQSDLCGWVGKMGYEKEDIYGANVFTAESAQKIAAAGFYATGSNTEYEVYIVRDFKNVSSLFDRKKVAEGVLEQGGYYTVDFSEPVEVSKGERFAVMLYLRTPGATHPMAIEYDSGEKALRNVDLEDGEGYISNNGMRFIDVKTKQDCNLCIKAYAND